MERKSVILIAIIIIFGLGFYLALTIGSFNFEESSCGKYRLHLQDAHYQECLQENKTALICENESIDRAWVQIQGLTEDECRTAYEEETDSLLLK